MPLLLLLLENNEVLLGCPNKLTRFGLLLNKELLLILFVGLVLLNKFLAFIVGDISIPLIPIGCALNTNSLLTLLTPKREGFVKIEFELFIVFVLVLLLLDKLFALNIFGKSLRITGFKNGLLASLAKLPLLLKQY